MFHFGLPRNHVFIDGWVYAYPGRNMCETQYGEQLQIFNESNVHEFLTSNAKQPVALKFILPSRKTVLYELTIQGQNLQCGATGGIWVVSVNEHGDAEACRAYQRGHNACTYRCSCQGQCHFVWINIVPPATDQITQIWNWKSVWYLYRQMLYIKYCNLCLENIVR